MCNPHRLTSSHIFSASHNSESESQGNSGSEDMINESGKVKSTKMNSTNSEPNAIAQGKAGSQKAQNKRPLKKFKYR